MNKYNGVISFKFGSHQDRLQLQHSMGWLITKRAGNFTTMHLGREHCMFPLRLLDNTLEDD